MEATTSTARHPRRRALLGIGALTGTTSAAPIIEHQPAVQRPSRDLQGLPNPPAIRTGQARRQPASENMLWLLSERRKLHRMLRFRRVAGIDTVGG